MPSRLDRLFILLDQGTTDAIRKAAALQLGEVQKLHPHDFNNLLSKVKSYLHSNSWDTRIAASLAVEAIIKNIPQWSPTGIDKTSETLDSMIEHVICKREGSMSFDLFNINSVIECGKNLLASEGNEYDISEVNCENSSRSLKDKLNIQRKLLNRKLGLEVAEKLDLGISSNEIFSNEDLSNSFHTKPENTSNKERRELKELINKKCGSTECKRKAYDEYEMQSKRIKSESLSEECQTSCDTIIANEWPLQSFTDELLSDIFNPNWEIRHGAVTALREIVKVHGNCGGRRIDAFKQDMDLLNQIWLEDLSLRLICVLALDKFGDFVSDQVVAPVRETCAQALGSVFNVMSKERVFSAVDILLQLLVRPEWETRHGGLLGLKYLLAVRRDLTKELLPKVFDSIFVGLKDAEDDVSSVAAAALVPVKDSLIESLPEKVPIIIDFLWDVLIELDDLTSSTSNILMLLSSLLTRCENEPTKLKQLVPRLWPFLGHNHSSVRKSVLESLFTLNSTQSSSSSSFPTSSTSTSFSSTINWLDIDMLSESLRLLYQRCLIESNDEILELLYKCWYQFITNSTVSDLLSATYQYLSGWICLMMHPSRSPIDLKNSRIWYCPRRDNSDSKAKPYNIEESEKYYLGGSESLNEAPAKRDKIVTRARLAASRFIGLLARYISLIMTTESPSPLECFTDILLHHLNSKSAIQKACVGWIIKEWSSAQKQFNDINALPQSIIKKCTSCLKETIYFDEVALLFTRIQYDTRDFVSMMKTNKLSFDENVYKANTIYTMSQIYDLLTNVYPASLNNFKLRAKIRENLEDKKKSLLLSYEEFNKYQGSLFVTVGSSIASCLISWNIIPADLDSITLPLLESIKKEENETLQRSSATHLTLLLDLCINKTHSSTVDFIISDLVRLVCSDIDCSQKSSEGENLPQKNSDENFSTILTLKQMYKASEKPQIRRSNSSNSMKKSFDVEDTDLLDEGDKSGELLRKGASFALIEIVSHFGSRLSSVLPQLWNYITDIERLAKGEKIDENNEKSLILSCSVLEVICSSIHSSLYHFLTNILESLVHCLENESASIRHMGARCLGVLSTVIEKETMDFVLGPVLEMLGARDSDARRQGATEAIHWVLEKMKIRIVPYIVLLVIPMLGRMSDQNSQVRLLATQCFASLVRLMPLDNGAVISSDLQKRKASEFSFLSQLMNPKKIEDYVLPIPINAELRCYQQEGINWLAFLNRYKLHGILCDEMGLGKTLMSICILACDHAARAKKWRESEAVDSKPLPSLVVCPPTLTGHWVYEVCKFIEPKYLKPLHYTGSPGERTKLRSKLNSSKREGGYNLVIASYDIVRNDIDFFGSLFWNYCILDEGHIIKNGKTKLSKAVKSISANHRLILTGTPIQNNVLELWSLFDFLMPGFLGTERQFIMKYSRPILQSRDGKCSSKDQENGVLAMEALHRQSLPFILRRMKEDVLKDLPPKIMQDHYYELSPLQLSLYEDFAKSKARECLENSMKDFSNKTTEANNKITSHIFQALHYLRKVCNHPKLVLSPTHPEYEKILAKLKESNSSLEDINQSAKLCALKQLLLDCGIGCQTSNSLVMTSEPVVNQHRALIFCQLKVMLDIVENDLLKAHMPNVSYLRLDGSVPAGSRHSIVHRFNNDPTIDILLLTTQVGGLGLNLTGADTVIFVEHDWNPMKDLQAMDRAHRIGQKKVVNVYRLITKGTLEEKIMGLQQFKLTIANTVISSENSHLRSMGTDQLLDLFSLDNKETRSQTEENLNKRVGMKAVLENLPELWDAAQYENEYDLSNFIKSLK